MKTLKVVLSMSILLMLTLIPFRVDAKGQFKDVSDKHWAQEEIDYLTSKQFINGFPDGSFKPNDRMNRADVAVVIAKVLQLELDRASDINFKDVPDHHYAKDAIAAVAKRGIIQGYNGSYSPKKLLTRGEIAAIFTRAFELSGHSGKDFKDVGRNHIFYKDVQAMAANQVTTGYAGDLFKPSENVTRAEFTVFLTRAMKLNKEESEPKKEESNQFELEVLKLTNEMRLEHGLQTLKRDTKVEQVAQKKSEDMRDKNYFDHTSPTYGSPFDMLKSHGISYRFAGENIAAGQVTPKEVVEAWMNSQGHRENILNPNYTHLAVGYAEGGSYLHYWTQMFTAY